MHCRTRSHDLFTIFLPVVFRYSLVRSLSIALSFLSALFSLFPSLLLTTTGHSYIVFAIMYIYSMYGHHARFTTINVYYHHTGYYYLRNSFSLTLVSLFSLTYHTSLQLMFLFSINTCVCFKLYPEYHDCLHISFNSIRVVIDIYDSH